MATTSKRRRTEGQTSVTQVRSRKGRKAEEDGSTYPHLTGNVSSKCIGESPDVSSCQMQLTHKKFHVQGTGFGKKTEHDTPEPRLASGAKESGPARLMFQDIEAPKTKYSRHMKHSRKEKCAGWKEKRQRENLKLGKTDCALSGKDKKWSPTATDSIMTPGEHTQNYSHTSSTKGKDGLKGKQNKSGGSGTGKSNPVAQTAQPKNNVFLPQNIEDYSVNWKQMLQTQGHEQSHCRPGAYASKREQHRIRTHSAEKSPEKGQIQKPLDVWFDDVDEMLLEGGEVSCQQNRHVHNIEPLVKPQSYTGLTKVVAMDCEMVGVGMEGKDSIVARVSLVNQYGQKIYDSYVRPTEAVTDYRTAVSGIQPKHIQTGKDLRVVQKEVSDILNGRVLVGHAVHHDLKVLFLDHPKRKIRDTSRYRPFRQLFKGQTPSLKKLTEKLVSVQIQSGEHSSVEDAQAAMRIYTLHRKQWEKDIKEKKKVNVCIKDRKTKYRSGQKKRTKQLKPSEMTATV